MNLIKILSRRGHTKIVPFVCLHLYKVEKQAKKEPAGVRSQDSGYPLAKRGCWQEVDMRCFWSSANVLWIWMLLT